MAGARLWWSVSAAVGDEVVGRLMARDAQFDVHVARQPDATLALSRRARADTVFKVSAEVDGKGSYVNSPRGGEVALRSCAHVAHACQLLVSAIRAGAPATAFMRVSGVRRSWLTPPASRCALIERAAGWPMVWNAVAACAPRRVDARKRRSRQVAACQRVRRATPADARSAPAAEMTRWRARKTSQQHRPAAST